MQWVTVMLTSAVGDSDVMLTSAVGDSDVD